MDLSAIGKIDVQILTGALRVLGLAPSVWSSEPSKVCFGSGEWIDTATGKSNLAWNRDINQIKQAYSAEVVKTTAKKYGWLLKETAPFQYAVTKRAF